MFDKPFTFDRVVRILFSLALIGGIIYLISILHTVLLPFLIGWLMAYMVQPVVKFFQYKVGLKNRILSIVAMLVSCALVITLLVLIVVPSIAQEADKTLILLTSHEPGEGNIPFIPQSWITYIEENIDVKQLMDLLSRDNIINALKQMAPKMWTVLSNTFSVLFSITIIFVIFLYFIFILLDYEKIVRSWLRLIPRRYRPFIAELGNDVEQSMNRYFRGQSLIAFCVGVLLAIGFKIIDFPLAVTLGLFIGVLNLIPYLQTIGLVPMVLLSLLKSAETGEKMEMLMADENGRIIACADSGALYTSLSEELFGQIRQGGAEKGHLTYSGQDGEEMICVYARSRFNNNYILSRFCHLFRCIGSTEKWFCCCGCGLGPVLTIVRTFDIKRMSNIWIEIFL